MGEEREERARMRIDTHTHVGSFNDKPIYELLVPALTLLFSACFTKRGEKGGKEIFVPLLESKKILQLPLFRAVGTLG